VVDPGVAPPPVLRRRWRRRAVVIAAALAVVATVAGVVVWRASTAEPESPEQVVEQFITADQRHDWAASWDLLCRSDRREVGSLDDWVHAKEATMAAAGGDFADIPFVVLGSRARSDSGRQSYAVDFGMTRDGETSRQQLLVVEEDDGLRVCSG
jgi:hypothetical protein